jgi:hypothetical protein
VSRFIDEHRAASASSLSAGSWACRRPRITSAPAVSRAEFERLEAAVLRRDAGTTLFARDDAGRVRAAVWVVWDSHAAHYLLVGADPNLRTSGASSLLLWEAIMRARAVTDAFDFHGSMLQSVERFFRAFGGRQTPYLNVTRTNPAVRVALTARSGWRRHSARR